MNDENITNRIKAEFPQNQQKGKNITKPTISKSFCRNLKLQNEAYPVTKNYKTNSFTKSEFLKTNFTKRIEADTPTLTGNLKLATSYTKVWWGGGSSLIGQPSLPSFYFISYNYRRGK
jgi:hypothetical protein